MKNFRTILLLTAFNLAAFQNLFGQAQKLESAQPTPANPIISPEFYISSIFDERIGQDSIGTLLFSTNEKSVTHKLALQSASLAGITKTLGKHLVRNTTLTPISIRIKECRINENLLGNDRVSGEVNLIFMFDLEKEAGSVPLTQYKSTARYTRSLTNLSIVEPTLEKVLSNSLKFLNGWLQAEKSTNPKLAKGLKISFREYLDQHDDTVYYDPSRPLTWEDFREKRSESKFAASVFPSFGYDQRIKTEDGKIAIELVLKVFVVKSASWVGRGTRSNYNLQHEQRHFDLVKLVAERFKKKLLTEKLTPENYQGIINFEYLEFYREMNKIQQEYDDQTSHGLSAVIQEFWNRKIDAELKLVEN
ncbi:hypothetical protein [Daejeonella lutea]|uniref:DUF922 domain-containing protein n=1 Tax=Daejeonella lutea TaxID=572036 RepID=A0A1T5A7X4_9SPHI|nr:hypothetical protein [Daejeonella lutea]SKB31015.1 hypothetical protein SAMN05661099_0418 [Daejeonella lutea]